MKECFQIELKEEEIEETTITEEEEEDVEEGMKMGPPRLNLPDGEKKPKPPKEGPAPIATNRLKKEYEEKFANIEATSKLHETKQDRLNKRLMEWCTK